MRTSLALVAAPLLALSVGTGIASASVSAADVQQMISAQFAQAGVPPAAVVCPGDLDTEVGSSITCAVTMGSETRGLTITVASTDGGPVKFTMELARQ